MVFCGGGEFVQKRMRVLMVFGSESQDSGVCVYIWFFDWDSVD